MSSTPACPDFPAVMPTRQGMHRTRRRCPMKQRQMGARPWRSLLGCLVLCLCLVPTAWAQQTTGTISVTVMDSSGGVIPGRAVDTDGPRHQRRPHGNDAGGGQLLLRQPQLRQLQADRVPPGLRDAELRRAGAVGPHHGREGDVEGRRLQDVVEVVGGVTPLVESTTNAINTTIDVKQIEDLPLARPQHRAAVAAGGRLQRHLERLAVGGAGQHGGRHRRQHQPLALSVQHQRLDDRHHAAPGEHRGNGRSAPTRWT